ncbi:MAG: MarR family winged helix-turn-helix transcriptional regulator [Candidatus Dormibacteria bacterium]
MTQTGADVQQPTRADQPRFQEDADGFLFDCTFRDMIAGRVDRAQIIDAEALRSVVIAGKVVSHRFEESLRGQALTHTQFRTLMALRFGSSEGIQMHQIAGWLGVTPRNVTALVDQLESLELVVRVPDPRDRRAFIVRLTAAGEEKAIASLAVNTTDQKRVLGSLTQEEKKQLRHLCMKLVRAAQPARAPKEVTA